MVTFFLQRLCLVIVLIITEVAWYVLYRCIPPMDGPATIACVIGYVMVAGGIGYTVCRYVPTLIEFAWDKYYDGA